MNTPIHITSTDPPREMDKKAKAIARETTGRKVNCYYVKHDKMNHTVSIPLEPNFLLTVRSVAECTIEIDHGYYELTPSSGIVINLKKKTIDTGGTVEYDEHVNTGVSIFYDELDIELKQL